jgi:hypothetical protein
MVSGLLSVNNVGCWVFSPFHHDETDEDSSFSFYSFSLFLYALPCKKLYGNAHGMKKCTRKTDFYLASLVCCFSGAFGHLGVSSKFQSNLTTHSSNKCARKSFWFYL